MSSIPNPSIDGKDIFRLGLLRDDPQALSKLIHGNFTAADIDQIPEFFRMLDFQRHEFGLDHVIRLHRIHVLIIS